MISFPMNQKVLFVHLLRLGDVLMLLPSIMRFRKSYPKAEIHLLLNDNCSILSSIIERYVDKIHYFQRDLIQQEIVDANANLFSPYYQIESFIQELNSENFDYVVNFTQNYLSAYLCSLIEAEKKEGMLFENDKILIKGEAFQNINKEENDPNVEKSHFIDAFFKALNLNSPDVENWKFLGLNSQIEKPYILFQTHTNEEIKTLSSIQWVNLFENMKPFIHDYEIRILCAPNEEEKTQSMLALLDDELKNSIYIHPCSFSKALELIEDASLLVTVDTSIKHLSNFTSTRVLELSLGSSDIKRTGIYKEGAFIFQPTVSCLPCTHSKGCTMAEHLCANSINLNSLASLIFSLAKDPLSIHQVYPELELNGTLFSVFNKESKFNIKSILESSNYINQSDIGDTHESNT